MGALVLPYHPTTDLATCVEHPLSYGRKVMSESGDTLASPVGWHTLPYEHDPSIGEDERRRAKDHGGKRSHLHFYTCH